MTQELKKHNGFLEQSNTAEDLVAQGHTMVQTRTQYVTAVQVQKPRVLDDIYPAIIKEAEYAKDRFYYSWAVNDKGERKIIEGPSIKLALSIQRLWGNCYSDVEILEDAIDHYKLKGIFIDLETGATFTQPYKHKKKVTPKGFSNSELNRNRWEVMDFNDAVSRAKRGAILQGVPMWLVDEVVETAKQAAINAIKSEGVDDAKKKSIAYFKGLGIDIDKLETFLNKKQDKWTKEDIASLRGVAQEIKDGSPPDEIFGVVAESGSREEIKVEDIPHLHPPENKPEPEKQETNGNGTRKRRTQEELVKDKFGEIFGTDEINLALQKIFEANKGNWTEAWKSLKDMSNDDIRKEYLIVNEINPEPEPELKPEPKPEPPKSEPVSDAVIQKQQRISSMMSELFKRNVDTIRAELKAISGMEINKIGEIPHDFLDEFISRLEVRKQELQQIPKGE